MNGHRGDKQRVIRAPGDAAAGARKNLGGRKTLPRRIEDDGEVHGNERHHERRGGALPDIEPHVHGFSSPFRYASAVRRFSPAIEAVGLSASGQCSWQDWWEWQAWQPPAAATAYSRAALPASRSSFTSVQVRLSAAGPR